MAILPIKYARARGLSALALALALTLVGCGETQRTPEQHIERAKDYLGEGKSKEAEIELRNALAQAPDNPQAHILLAEISMSTGNYLMAETALKKAAETGVSPHTLRYPMARALLMQGRAEEALKASAPETQDSQLNRLRLLDIQSRALLQLGRMEESCARVGEMRGIEADDVLTLLGGARCAYAQGRDFATAEAALRAALGEHDGNAEIWGMLADLAWQQDKKKEAEQAYLEAIKRDPFQHNARIGLVTLYLADSRLDEALEQAETARKVNPTPFSNYLIARVQFSKGNHQLALDQAAQVLKTAGDHLPSLLIHGASALSLGRMQVAEQHLGRYLAQNPGSDYARQLLASAQLRNNAPDKALETVAPLLRATEQDLRTLALAGEVYQKLGDFNKAAFYLDKVTRLDPDATSFRVQHGATRLAAGDIDLGLLELEAASRLDLKEFKADAALVAHHLSTRDHDKALAAIENWLGKQPANPMPYNLRGFVKVTRGDKAGAREDFDKALVLRPDFMPALKNLARLDVSDNNIDGARKRFQNVLAKDAGNLDAMLEMASLAARENKRAESAQWLRKAADAHPKAMEPRLRLVRHHLAGNASQQALAAAREALTAQPDSPDALELLARVQSAIGEHESAASSLSRALALKPDAAELHYQLALVQGVLLRGEAVKASLNRAIALQPGHPQASKALALLEQEQGNAQNALRIARQLQRVDARGGQLLEGDILMKQNKPREALAAYQKAWSQRAGADLVSRLHQAMLASGNAAGADAHISNWLREHDGDLANREYLALSHLQRKQFPQAAAQYEALLRLQPGSGNHLNNLAWIYQAMGDARALDLAEQAHRIAPDHPAVLDTLGWILVSRGDTRRGLELLQRAVSKPVVAAGTRYRLAAALAKTGDKVKARQILRPLLRDAKAFPERGEAQALLEQLG